MLSALSFLTIFGSGKTPTRTTLAYFPIAGVLIGAAVAAAHYLSHQLWSPISAAVVVLAFDAAITGALHYDGLADSADGLLAHMEPERRLEVMREPTLGVFAAITLIVVSLSRLASFSDPELPLIALAAIWAAARIMAAIVMLNFDYARKGGGLATAFIPTPKTRTVTKIWLLCALTAAAFVLIYCYGTASLAIVAAVAATAWVVARTAKKRIGGYTGDVIGAVITLSETVGLLVVANLNYDLSQILP